mmetsp:Transcript_11134/g.16247  ORF Transcript_11134/g.16247 Transcript_11134/m.16247 type:complete len:118 (+) Transcript_11134:472-825(+)
MGSSEICPKSQKVVVIGANGQTDSRVVNLLNQSPNYQPVAMIRDRSQASKFNEIGVPYFVGDLNGSNSPTVDELEGADAVIFAAGAGRSRPNIKKVIIVYLAAVRSIAASLETKSVK